MSDEPSAGQRLYELLPALYRLRDPGAAAGAGLGGGDPAAGGLPLRTLLEVIGQQVGALEDDLQRLYDDAFIETCQPWVIPYIGDLLRVRVPHATTPETSNLRAFVAGTLGYRRRKGTVAVLEQLAHDVAGWPARAVEMFQRLATNQNINHLRPGNLRTPDLRNGDALERLGGAFEEAASLVDVRRIANGRGRYNLPHIGIFLWRLGAYPFGNAVPWWDETPPAGAAMRLYRFHPLGRDVPLFAPGRAEDSIEHLAEESDVPGPLRRRALHEDLEVKRTGSPSAYFEAGRPAFRIEVGGTLLSPDEIEICNLGSAEVESAHLDPARASALPPPRRARVDPVTGRFALGTGVAPETVRVTYHHGASADVGGGEYDRSERLSDTGARSYQAVAGGGAALEAALGAWTGAGRPPALIEITDNLHYQLAAALAVDGSGALEIRAANRQRPVLEVTAPGGVWPVRLAAGAELRLGGVLFAGGLALEVDTEGTLAVDDATVQPPLHPPAAAPAVMAAAAPGRAARLEVAMSRTMSGPLLLTRLGAGGLLESSLSVSDAIVDAGGAPGLALEAGLAALERATVLGRTEVSTLSASNTLLVGPVHADRTQEGCVRFSFLPDGSRAPRRYRCQPDLALSAAPASQRTAVLARVVPVFTSTRWGDPGYAQLARRGPDELRTGAENESEMGAYAHLRQPQREANLRAVFDEYLRFGLEAGLLFVT
jgi:hypothetical protein